jgi:AsmA protein
VKKKIVLVLASVVAVLVLAAVILFIVVDADDFRGFIETRAEESLGRDVRLGKISLSIVPVFGFQVEDVVVAARPGEGEGDLLSVRSLRIGAKLMPLLKKRLEVTSIEVVDPVVNFIRDPAGEWNFDLGADSEVSPKNKQPAGPGSGPEITVDGIRVTGGRLSILDASRSTVQPLEVALTDLDLEISGFGSDEFRVVVKSGLLDVADSALGPDPIHLEVGEIDLAVGGGGDSVDLKHFELVVGKTTVALTGTIKAQPDGRRIDLDLKPTDIDVADISSLLETTAGDLGVSISGNKPVEIEAGVHGVLAENQLPEIGVTARLSDLSIDADTLTQPVTDLSAVVELRGTTVVVDGLHAQVGESDFAGTLQFAFLDRPTLEFVIESQRADLGELLGLMASGEDDQSAPPDPDSFLVRIIADGSLKVAEGSWVNLHFRDLDARLRLDRGVATLEPVSMKLYDGRFSGRLASDLTQRPQPFEFSGEAEGIDMDPFVADQTGKSDILMGRFTGRVAGTGAGSDLTTVMKSLQGEGVARIVEGQVGRLDVLRSVGQVAGVLGQQTLANLATSSATGATKFSQLAGDFRIGGGALNFDSMLLQAAAFDLSGTGQVDMLSSVMNGEFVLRFSPEVSAWMKQESSRAAELFWDSASGRVVLPLGLSGPLDGTGASVDWGAAVEDVARRTVERELTNAIGNLLGGSRSDEPDKGAVTSPDTGAGTSAAQTSKPAGTPVRRAKAPSGLFTLMVAKTEWVGPSSAQNFKIMCKVTGAGVERATMKAVDAGGKKVQNATKDLAARLADVDTVSFEFRVNGEKLALAEFPVTVTLTAIGTDAETAELNLKIRKARK